MRKKRALREGKEKKSRRERERKRKKGRIQADGELTLGRIERVCKEQRVALPAGMHTGYTLQKADYEQTMESLEL